MTKQEGIIRYQAIGCLLRMGYSGLWSLEDLIQEGHICLQKARERWRPDGGAKFNSYLTTLLINRFAKIVKKRWREGEGVSLVYETKDTRTIAYLDDKVHTFAHKHMSLMFHIPFDLSPDAERFLLLTFEPPQTLRDRIRQSKGRMCHIIKRYLNWTNARMRNVEREIRAAI